MARSYVRLGDPKDLGEGKVRPPRSLPLARLALGMTSGAGLARALPPYVILKEPRRLKDLGEGKVRPPRSLPLARLALGMTGCEDEA